MADDSSNHKKWQIGWGTVAECNMKCGFCYSRSARENISGVGFEEWKNFIDQNNGYIGAINYGTGENTLSDDWFKLIKYIRDFYPSIRQALTTNGYLFEQIKNPKHKEIFIQSIDEVDVSLDFDDESKHCAFRGSHEAFRWALNSLALCQKHSIPATIVFIGTPETAELKNVEGLFKIAKDFDAILRLNIYRPVHADPNVNNKFIIPFEKVVNVLHYASDHHKILALGDPLFCSILTNEHTEQDPFATNSVRILSDGSITPSTYLISQEFRRHNIKQNNILHSLSYKHFYDDIIK